jgi:hypothetical protein
VLPFGPWNSGLTCTFSSLSQAEVNAKSSSWVDTTVGPTSAKLFPSISYYGSVQVQTGSEPVHWDETMVNLELDC